MNSWKVLVLALATSVGLSAHAMVSSETKAAADRLGASNLTEVKFDERSATLSDSQKKDLQQLVADARTKGEIKEIKVMVWPDKEYPTAHQKAAKADIDLADARAKEIKKYMKDTLAVNDVDVYNMAERPNKLEEWFKTSDAKVKDTAEASGAAPRTKHETGFLGLKGQSSKAVALVFMK